MAKRRGSPNPPLPCVRVNAAPHLDPVGTRRTTLLAAGGLVLLGLAAYHATLRVPFLFDDASAVLGNASIRHLWPPGPILQPPSDATVAGRPLLNLSFALNYAVGGLDPRGYHAFNLAVHLIGGLALFGLAARTLRSPALRNRFGAAADFVAFTLAAVWLLHPVQTASVTYVSQRAESMMGAFYLLTLYAFSRRTDSPHPGRWDLAAVICAVLGAVCKEVMMTAPVVVLLYDRTFVSGSFGAAWRRHRRVYLGLAASWLVLGWQLTGLRGGHAVGFGQGTGALAYALTECEVVVRYLGLAIWPDPLVFDYGETLVRTPAEMFVYAGVLAALLIGTGALLRWRPVAGFLAACFFVILAPTSSVVPIVHQPMAENRLYLPLAAIVAGGVAGSFVLAGRRAFFAIAAVLIAGLAALTLQRNRDFESEISIWRDTVAKRPENPRARYNYGHALAAAHRVADAVPEYLAALRLKPDYAEAHHNLGNALAALGRPDEAVPHYQAALRLEPNYASAHYNLGTTLVELGQWPAAIQEFEQALRLEPGAAGVHYNLGAVLARTGRVDDAIAHYAESLRLSPVYPEAQTNWGNLLAQSGRWADAKAHYESALATSPGYVEAHINLGNALLQLGQRGEAIRHYEAAIRLEPRSAEAHYNLGNLQLGADQLDAAIGNFRAAVELQPSLAGAQHNLALALVRSGRVAEAVPYYEATLKLVPDSTVAHYNLAIALERLGRFAEAVTHDEEALRLQPDFAAAREQLARLRRR